VQNWDKYATTPPNLLAPILVIERLPLLKMKYLTIHPCHEIKEQKKTESIRAYCLRLDIQLMNLCIVYRL